MHATLTRLRTTAPAVTAGILLLLPLPAALGAEKVDTAAVARIRHEGMERSQVMQILSRLVDVCGPRLTGSPEYTKAAVWARGMLTAWGLENARLEGWGPFGKAWSLQRYSAQVIEPYAFPLISYPKAWSPGTGGTVRGEAVYFNPETDSALQTFRGRLRDRFALISEPRVIEPRFRPRATRESDQSLLDLANADFPRPWKGRPAPSPEIKEQRRRARLLAYDAMELLMKEGALAVLTASHGDGGAVFVQGADVVAHPDTPYSRQYRAFENGAPRILPQIQVGGEHYNHLCRLLDMGVRVELEMRLEVEVEKADSSYNVIAEIPGTDLRDQVVMIGAHLDSWHGGTGTTDNGTGVATCMEAVRIIKALGLHPRRTIRIGLWSGEEQGLFGSRSYVEKHLGRKEIVDDSVETVRLTPEGEQFSVYFNNDNGTGRVRGVYLQGNEAVRPVFRTWLTPFGGDGAATLTLANTGGTDHQAFEAIGLPAFQFIQDDIEYMNLSWHSTMDLYERAVEDDLKQTSVVLATFAYNAAMRDELIPRKPPVSTEGE